MTDKKRSKRSRYAIIKEILEQCKEGAKKTWIMYRANLSYDITRNYLKVLLEANVIEQKGDLYFLTQKGQELLGLLQEYVELTNKASDLKAKIDSILPANVFKSEEEEKENNQSVTQQPANITQAVPSTSTQPMF